MSKEEYQLKQQQKVEEREKERQKKRFKKVAKLIAAILLFGGIIFAGGWYLTSRVETGGKSDIISKVPIHWHPELKIKILGEYQKIPANIGIGVVHRLIHTHADDSVIHIESTGLVREDDIRLGRFFEIWGKTFNKDCIFDKCSGSEGKVTMLVNDKENQEFENYIMRDGDKIEIIYE